MRYAIYIPPDTKDLAINLTMVAYENRQNATTFARANNFDLSRELKHSSETSFYREGQILPVGTNGQTYYRNHKET